MKFFVALLVVLAYASATQISNEQFEKARQERFVTDQIETAINGLIQRIVDANLDPLHIYRAETGISIPPTTEEIKAIAWAEVVQSTGLSNIVIDRINFELFAARLRLTLRLPRVDASVGAAAAELNVFGHRAVASANGRAAIRDATISADVRLNISIIHGISIRSLAVDFTLGGIESALNVQVLNRDLSEYVNNLLSNIVPTTIAKNRDTLNRYLAIVLLPIIEENLP